MNEQIEKLHKSDLELKEAKEIEQISRRTIAEARDSKRHFERKIVQVEKDKEIIESSLKHTYRNIADREKKHASKVIFVLMGFNLLFVLMWATDHKEAIKSISMWFADTSSMLVESVTSLNLTLQGFAGQTVGFILFCALGLVLVAIIGIVGFIGIDMLLTMIKSSKDDGSDLLRLTTYTAIFILCFPMGVYVYEMGLSLGIVPIWIIGAIIGNIVAKIVMNRLYI
ncbi:MAG: hypothetical protein ACRCW1_05850 [Anaerotignaceae bacterium]